MALDQQDIVRTGGASPFDVTIPASAVVQPLTVEALIDGSGAGGSFIPAVVIIDQSGAVIARAADPANTFAAGLTVEGTWFPGVKNGGGSTPVVGTPNLPWCVAEGDLPDNGTPATYFDFATVDGTMFALDGTSQHVLIMQTGLYLVLMSASYSDAVTAAATVFALDGSFGSGGTKTYLQLTSSNDSVAEGLNAGGANNTWNVEQWFLVSVTAVTTGLRVIPALTSNPHAGVSADSYVFCLRLNVSYPGGL